MVISVNVTKVEKTIVYSLRLNPKGCKIDNQQLRPQGKAQRLSRKGVHSSEWKWRSPKLEIEGYDIVYAYMKV